MKAMIFAAGLGTRLKPFTLHHPKALVEVGGKPMLQHVIENIARAGIHQIIINVHHFADQIAGFVSANHNFGQEILISDETDELLDTGGGLLNVRSFLDCEKEPFLVHNADILTDLPLRYLIDSHCASGADVTLLADRRTSQRQLWFSAEEKRLRGWSNSATGASLPPGYDPSLTADTPLAFGGVHVISPSIFPYLEAVDKKAFPIVPVYVSACRQLNIRAYQPEAGSYRWFDIGKPEALERARESFED